VSDPPDQRLAEFEAETAALRARIAALEKKVEDLTQRVRRKRPASRRL
jgi:ubiquinone biosynthesis protein UbiJ